MPAKKWWNDDSDKEDGEDNQKGKIKWKSLEHHGVTFFPSYTPHGVKILHNVNILSLMSEIGKTNRLDSWTGRGMQLVGIDYGKWVCWEAIGQEELWGLVFGIVQEGVEHQDYRWIGLHPDLETPPRVQGTEEEQTHWGEEERTGGEAEARSDL